MQRWSTRPSSPGWRITYPNLMGAIVLPVAAGVPVDAITRTPGPLSGATPPTWDRPDPIDGRPTLLFTQGASLNSYADFGVHNAFMNLGVNKPMTLIARIRWTGGKGGIAERTGTGMGWAWGVSSNNTLMFLKKQSVNVQGREDATPTGGTLSTGVWITVAVTYEGEIGSNGGTIRNYFDGVVGLGGNNSTGSGTNQDDSTGAFHLGNSTIDLPGVGNPTMAGSFGGNIAWIVGFHRVLSLAEIRSFSYLRGVPSTLWRHVGRQRRARYLHEDPPLHQLTIDGQVVAMQAGSVRITRTLNSRGTMSCAIVSMDGTYRPEGHKRIIYRHNGVRMFAGTTMHPDESGHQSVSKDPIITQLESVDFKEIAGRVEMELTIPAGSSVRDAFELLMAPLEPAGVSVDPAMAAGATFDDEVVLGQGTIEQHCDTIAAKKNQVWEIDYDLVARMYTPGDRACDFDIADGDRNVLGDLKVATDLSNYYNRVRVKFTFPAETAFVYFVIDNLPSDGTTFKVAGRTFTFRTAPVDPDDVLIEATIVDQYDRVVDAIDPLDEVTAFNQTIRVDVKAAEPGQSGNSIQVESNDGNGGADFHWSVEGSPIASHLYHGRDDALLGSVTAEDVPEQNGGENLRSITYEEPTITDPASAQELADGYLARHLARPKTVGPYETKRLTAFPGLSQHVQAARRNLDDDALITDVEIFSVGHRKLRSRITLNTGLIVPPTDKDTYRQRGLI